MLHFLGLSLNKPKVTKMFSRHVFVQAGPLNYHSKFSYAMSGQRYEQILCCLCTLELGEKWRKQDSD